jgi:hypothetical protein
MRIAALLLLFSTIGCRPSNAPSGPTIRLVDVVSDEFKIPMPFALRIVNDGAPVQFDAIEGECRTRVIVSPDPNAQAPTSATMRVSLLDRSKPETVTLGYGQTLALRDKTEVWGVLSWDLPDDAPPLLGFFEVRFTLKRNGVAVFTTPLYAFAMQNKPGVFEEILAEMDKDRNDARALLKILEGMKGKPSPAVNALREGLKVSLSPAA